jgi:hypothetical protein
MSAVERKMRLGTHVRNGKKNAIEYACPQQKEKMRLGSHVRKDGKGEHGMGVEGKYGWQFTHIE